MSHYTLTWKRSALKDLRALPHDVIARVIAATELLVDAPRPPGARKLAGSDRAYRIRIGDYRVVYDIVDRMLIIEVVRVAHRSGVYRR